MSWYLALFWRLRYSCQKKGSGSNHLPQGRKDLFGFLFGGAWYITAGKLWQQLGLWPDLEGGRTILGPGCLPPPSHCDQSRRPAHGLVAPVFKVDLPSTKPLWKNRNIPNTSLCFINALKVFYSSQVDSLTTSLSLINLTPKQHLNCNILLPPPRPLRVLTMS